MTNIEDFIKLDIRAGKIVDVQLFPEAIKPAFKLKLDFGREIGMKHSSAQLTDNYTPEDLQDKMVLAVINLPPRRIGPFLSEVLVLGVPDEKGNTVLVTPESVVVPGAKLY